MPLRFAANLSFLFGEHPFPDRFGAAAAAGFTGVEFLAPYDFPPDRLARILSDAGLENVLFNLPPGDWAAGERGFAALPGSETQFRDGVALALRYASELGTRRLHAMAGIPPHQADPAICRTTYIANLSFAADACAAHGITLTIEPINGFDMPGYFLHRFEQALAVIEEIRAPNLRLQFDCYHAHRLGADAPALLAEVLPWVAHVQIAGSPQRREPDTGELPYGPIFRLLDDARYAGWIGCEYSPAGTTEAGLGWMKRIP